MKCLVKRKGEISEKSRRWGMKDSLFCGKATAVASVQWKLWMVDSICIFARRAKIIVATSVCTGGSNCPLDSCIKMGSNHTIHH